MATPLDVNKFTAKERKAARKDLMKKIEHYNKKMRKTKDRSFPLTTPAANLIYRGILKVTYDRGYAIQTKSMLVGSDSTAEDLIEQLIDSLGLTGSAEDYILEERNYMTQTTRTIRKSESPLDLQLQYGPHSSMLEIGLVQIRDNRILFSGDDTESDDDAVGLKRGHVNHVPKDEVIDHGAANVGSIMDEALHDIPINVSDIKEKIRLLSESIASEGKPRNDLPSRHSLWNILKPQVSNLMKDIRHLVDTAEFLTGKHCPSEEFRLIVTLLLELITDHSRELIAVTKELCGLKGVAKTDFNASVSNFVQQLTYISKLIGVISTSLHAAALSGHLLHATAPGNFLKAPLDEESSFTGSGGVSGALIFITTTAFLGLLRAAYEDKTDYYATFTSNMLQCARKTLETVHKTNNYVSIHLHPLRNRIADMERKLKLAMDSLVKKVKIAASSHPPPVSVPEMLLAGHSLIVASLDFLLVAQCASLLHKVVIGGHELIELPWVKGWITRSDNVTNEGKNSLGEKVSNASDSTTEKSFGTISTTSSSKHYREKKLRKAASHKKAEEETSNIALGQLTLQPSHLPMNYSDESGDDADDEGGISSVDFSTPKDKPSQRLDSPTESTSDVDSPIKQLSSQMFSNDNTKYIGIEGVQRLKQHQMLNKAIARDAEGLLLAVTQNVQFLSQQCHGDSKELYSNTIETLMEAARHLREEVSVMENELVNITNIQETLIATSERFHSLTRNVYMSLSSALSPQACDKDQMRLLTSAKSISDLCSETVQQSLSIVAEHNKAIEHAEKMENEFVTLMTGHNKTTDDRKDSDSVNHSNGKRKTLTGPKLPSDQEAESVIFEDLSTKKVTTAGRAWLAPRPTPKVSGGTLSQLTQRLTYHRVLDSEFATSFILSYHRYMSCDHLIKSLVEKYHINLPEDSHNTESEIVIAVRLRVVHALRLWLQYHPADFNVGSVLLGQLQDLLSEMESGNMKTCSEHLKDLLERDGKMKTSRKFSQPIIPQLIQGKAFNIMDCNTLELGRQLCLMYHHIYCKIQLKELLIISLEQSEQSGEWKKQIPGLYAVKVFTKKVSKLVSGLSSRDGSEEEQSLVISFFIKTAESCHQFKNYEGTSAIVNGLTSVIQSTRGAWQLLNESQTKSFKVLRDAVSKDGNFQNYRTEMKSLHLTPHIPLIDATVYDICSISREMTDTLPGKSLDIINFTKWRELSRVLLKFHSVNENAYNFTHVQIIQEYLKGLLESDT